jgi:hypothetical protein
MYVRKEVVYEGVQGGKRTYLLGGELGWMGRLQRMGGMDRRLRRGPRGLCFSNSSLLYGGPRRRLGRLKVHGISRPTQALHGGPDSSHWGHVSKLS